MLAKIILYTTAVCSVNISCIYCLLFKDGRFALANSCSQVDVLLRKTICKPFSCSSIDKTMSEIFKNHFVVAAPTI